MTGKDFMAAAEEMSLEVFGNKLTGEPRTFSSGAYGWYLGGKIEVSASRSRSLALSLSSLSPPPPLFLGGVGGGVGVIFWIGGGGGGVALRGCAGRFPSLSCPCMTHPYDVKTAPFPAYARRHRCRRCRRWKFRGRARCGRSWASTAASSDRRTGTEAIPRPGLHGQQPSHLVTQRRGARRTPAK